MTGQHYNACFWDHVQLLCGLAFYGKLNEPPKLSGGFSRFEASKPAKHNVVSFFLVSWGGSAGFWVFFFAWPNAFLHSSQWTSSQLMKNIYFNMGCWLNDLFGTLKKNHVERCLIFQDDRLPCSALLLGLGFNTWQQIFWILTPLWQWDGLVVLPRQWSNVYCGWRTGGKRSQWS